MTASSPGDWRYQTRQRRAILRALTTVSGFISAQDLYAHLRRAGEPVGLGTVYRTLHALDDAGDIDTTRTITGEQLFQYCTQPGCAYFLVCRQCGRRVALDAHPVEEWATATAAQHGFIDITLVAEIAGRCPACAAQPRTTVRSTDERPGGGR